MSEIDKFRELITGLVKGLLPVQTAWAKCKSVDWEKKTMVAVGITDDLEYFDVVLGIGNSYTKPKDGTKCLLGTIAGKEAATFLIMAQEADLNAMYGDHWEWNDGTNKGFVKLPELVQKMNVLEQDLNTLKQVFAAWTPAMGDGGGALKTASSAWAAQTITETLEADLENYKLKH